MESNMKEKWIDDVMGSLEGMSKAQPREDLYEGIMTRLSGPNIRTRPLLPKQWAAAAILLLALNVGSVVYFSERQHKTGAKSTDTNPFAMEIQSESTYNY